MNSPLSQPQLELAITFLENRQAIKFSDAAIKSMLESPLHHMVRYRRILFIDFS